MKQRPGIFEKYLWVIWYADVILLWRPNLIFLSESCWWCSWHKHQIKWALAPKSIVIALHGLSWDVTSILQTGLVATRSLKSRPKIKMRESSTLRVKFILCRCWTWYYSDTLVLSLYSPPTSDFKGNNQRIFHWRTSGLTDQLLPSPGKHEECHQANTFILKSSAVYSVLHWLTRFVQ